jgi:hypothetical protein
MPYLHVLVIGALIVWTAPTRAQEVSPSDRTRRDAAELTLLARQWILAAIDPERDGAATNVARRLGVPLGAAQHELEARFTELSVAQPELGELAEATRMRGELARGRVPRFATPSSPEQQALLIDTVGHALARRHEPTIFTLGNDPCEASCDPVRASMTRETRLLLDGIEQASAAAARLEAQAQVDPVSTTLYRALRDSIEAIESVEVLPELELNRGFELGAARHAGAFDVLLDVGQERVLATRVPRYVVRAGRAEPVGGGAPRTASFPASERGLEPLREWLTRQRLNERGVVATYARPHSRAMDVARVLGAVASTSPAAVVLLGDGTGESSHRVLVRPTQAASLTRGDVVVRLHGNRMVVRHNGQGVRAANATVMGNVVRTSAGTGVALDGRAAAPARNLVEAAAFMGEGGAPVRIVTPSSTARGR